MINKKNHGEIELEDVQGGDLIVCFFDNEGAEIRIKGIADHKDNDGDWLTEGGGYLTYDDGLDLSGIFLLERPEVKEPELADGTYWVTEKDVNDLCWWEVEVKDSKATWGICGDMTDVAFADYDYLVEVPKSNYHTLHTSNPFPEPTDLERFEQAGYVGNIYVRPNNTPYKVTDEGKVMAWYKDTGKWSNISWDFETFHRSMVAGAFTKIS